MDDLISRQAAIDALVKDCKGSDEGMLNMYDITCGLKGLPSAQPERKTGRWIPHPGGKFVGFPYMHYECDQCRDFEPEERNYCPNCGAKMEDNT